MTMLTLQQRRVFRVSQAGHPEHLVEAVAIMPLAIALVRLMRVRGVQVPHAVDEAPEVEAAECAWRSGRSTLGALIVEATDSIKVLPN